MEEQAFDIELVGKIGSMALIRPEDADINYNTISRICAELQPGMVWVTSGAAEIGRLDYIKRTGKELPPGEESKSDYAAQGQAILMANYRQFVRPEYSIRQLLVEHQHFNEEGKRIHIRDFLLRAARQGAIPIVNYNDPVSGEETRKMELTELREARTQVHECVDNDETAAVLAGIVRAKKLVILTSTEGIYLDPQNPQTLVQEVIEESTQALDAAITELQTHCCGASRAGANGAYAKLAYIRIPAMQGTEVHIGHARHRISDLLCGKIPHTCIKLGRAVAAPR